MSSVIKTEGFEAILQPLIQDVKMLENEGIGSAKVDGVYKFYGTVSVLIADNLAAHGLEGFQKCFNCLRNCRFCFVTQQKMQQITICNGFRMRSIEMHNAQLQNIALDETISSIYGVMFDSVLNKLDHFHIITGMPSDLAHDLFEGVVCEVLTDVIRYCMTEGYCTRETLNDSILKFPFCRMDKSNKPTTLSKVLRTFKVKQTDMVFGKVSTFNDR
jgi:hypothetical protein